VAEGGGEGQGTSGHNGAPDIFISYASQDTATADAIVEILERHGLRCWVAPRDVVPGSLYADEIVGAINEAKVVVLVLSEHSVKSPHVGKEIERASSKRRRIIALRTDSAPLTRAFEYFLSESQWVDLGPGGTETAAAKLVGAIRRHLGPVAASEPRVYSDQRVANRAATGLPRQWLVTAAVAIVAAIGLTYLLTDKFWLSRHTNAEHAAAPVAPSPTAPTISEKSIAVLPFLDMSAKKDQEYFADGMAEEIINLLAKVPDLRVPARTSSFYFKGKPTQVPEIARELGVKHVLEGSVRKSANRMRVTVQLIRADNGFHLWSQTYDRDLSDVFKVQDDIANAVVQAFRITLMGGPLTREHGGTQNLDAYQLLLRAESARSQNSKQSLEAADGYLDQALKLDPDYAHAWNDKAVIAALQVETGTRTPNDGFERARQFAQHALQLSPDLAEPHFLLGLVHRTYDWDWTPAQAELRQGLSIDPTSVLGLTFGGILSKTLGHWDDALRQLHAALDRDPMATFVHYNLGEALYLAGRFTDAEIVFRKLQGLAPDFGWTRVLLAKTLLAEGKPDAALATAQQENSEVYRLSSLPIFLQAVGRKTEAEETLKQVTTKSADSEAFNIAMVYAYRNERERAFEWLDRAYKQKDPALIAIMGEPLLNNLANDPRYKAFLRKMNLPD
jgi:TolB-like protein/Tfp pilus assembly protein PilF